MYVDPGHHIGVFQVDLHESGQSGSLGDDDPGSLVFRIWCLVYSQRKAPPVMITNNHDQELSVPIWSGDVGTLLSGLCIRTAVISVLRMVRFARGGFMDAGIGVICSEWFHCIGPHP